MVDVKEMPTTSGHLKNVRVLVTLHSLVSILALTKSNLPNILNFS